MLAKGRGVGHILNDLQHGLRLLRKAPLFTILITTSLGVGIGANGAIFTLLDQIVLRPLPVEKPQRLVQVHIDGDFHGNSWGDGTEISYPMFLDLRDHKAFSGMFAQFPWAMHVNVRGRTERVNGELVSGRYFSVLGVPAAIGRLITEEDDRVRNATPVAVLSHAFWRSHYARDPKVIGQTLTINSHTFTVVGVARERFDGIDVGRATRVFVPMAMKPQLTPGWNGLDERRMRFAKVFGRLRDDVEIEQARAALQPLFHSIRQTELADAYFAGKTDAVKKEFAEGKIALTVAARGHSRLTDSVDDPLWILMGIGSVVLLVACANVAGLLLARGMGRQREVAIRLALGASRRRIAAQLMFESLLLAILGSAAGLLVASWAISPLMVLLVGSEDRTAIATTPDLRVVAFMMILGCLTAILFGLVPAVQASRAAAGTALKDRSATSTGRSEIRTRKVLVAAQVALALVLVVGSALFLRSLRNLLTENPGFVAANLVSFSIEPSLNGYSPERVKELAARLRGDLKRTPGVSDVAFLGVRILEGGSWNSGMTVAGAGIGRQHVFMFNNTVTPGYFATMRIPLLAGRDFTDQDRRIGKVPEGEPDFRVAIVNQLFVDRHLKGANPIGARLGFGQDPSTPTNIEIVGVVGTSKYVGIKDDAGPQAFFPMLENEVRTLTGYVRTSVAPDTLFAAVRRIMQGIDPALPVFDMITMETQVGRSVADDRMMAFLATVLAFIGTVLCVVGLYGVVAYTVFRRTREVGIRVALGAVRRQIALLFFREAVIVVILGIAAALPLLMIGARAVQTQLHRIDALNPATIALAIASLAGVALAGALVPALRAARIHPMNALREE
jgi:predicted permease